MRRQDRDLGLRISMEGLEGLCHHRGEGDEAMWDGGGARGS